MYIDFAGTKARGTYAACLLALAAFGCGGRLDTSSELPPDDADGSPVMAPYAEKATCAQTPPPECEGTLRFADARLQSWVRDAAKKSTDEPLRYEDVCSLLDLKISSADFTIVSLSGIECLDQLRVLELEKIATPDLSPLAKLVELNELSLPNIVGTSDLTALASLTELRTLSLGAANGDELSLLATLPHLSELNLSSSNLYDLHDLSALRNISFLGLENGAVSDLTPLLDVFEPGAILELGATQLDCSSQRGNLDVLAARNVSVRPEGLCR